MSTITVGIDLAKNVFTVHGVDDDGKAVLVKPKVARDTLLELVANLPPCLIGMEACSGAHHWARRFRTHGHTVRLMAPKFIAPYRLSGKRGKAVAADAAAIREFGIVLPQKVANPRRRIGEHLEDLPGYANRCVGDLLAHADVLDERIAEYDRAIAQVARDDARSRRLMELPGIGPTTASALLASLGGGLDRTHARAAIQPRRHGPPGGGGSPGPATATCAACWSWGRVPFPAAWETSRTASVAGRGAWWSGGAIGGRWWSLPPRMRAWPGRC